MDSILGSTSIDLLKIDVEGADTWVLEGAERLLRVKRIERVWFEQHKLRMKKLGIAEGAAQSFLQSVEYSAWPLGDVTQGAVDWMAVPA